MTSPESPSVPTMDRRDAIKWMLAAAASAALLDRSLTGAQPVNGVPGGYGTDPDLIKAYNPGDVWPLTFTAEQRTAAAALCDVIIPADDKGPSASSLRVHEFIDEWISAPYPGHDADRSTIVEGLAWLEAESRRRFGQGFVNLGAAQKHAICDDICYVPNAKPEFRQGAQFFRRFRDLAAGGYYTTPEGMKDIGYVGNFAMEKYEGPTPAALRHLGLA